MKSSQLNLAKRRSLVTLVRKLHVIERKPGTNVLLIFLHRTGYCKGGGEEQLDSDWGIER